MLHGNKIYQSFAISLHVCVSDSQTLDIPLTKGGTYICIQHISSLDITNSKTTFGQKFSSRILHALQRFANIFMPNNFTLQNALRFRYSQLYFLSVFVSAVP